MLLASAGCALASVVYAQFSHGVRSASMERMFLYPLLGGALAYAVLLPLWDAIARGGLARPGMLCLHSGIATLTAGAFLRGILQIAGSSSPYPPAFMAVGWVLYWVGIGLFVVSWGRGGG